MESYKQRGPRVVLMGGTGWSDAMRRHYDVCGEPFFRRPSLPTECPGPNGHPWGWVCKPDELMKDECRWLPATDIERLKDSLNALLQIQDTPGDSIESH